MLMPTNISDRFLEIVQKHFESGVSIKDLNLSDDQKKRLRVCKATYERFVDNPMMNVRNYLKNFWGRTEAEIRNDNKVITFIISMMSDGTRKFSEYRVRHVGNKLITMGESMGDWKPMEAGAKLLIKADKLDQPEGAINLEESTFKLQPVFTQDITKIDKDRKQYSEEEREKLRKKYGAARDHIQEMVQSKTGEFVPADYDEEEDYDNSLIEEERNAGEQDENKENDDDE